MLSSGRGGAANGDHTWCRATHVSNVLNLKGFVHGGNTDTMKHSSVPEELRLSGPSKAVIMRVLPMQ